MNLGGFGLPFILLVMGTHDQLIERLTLIRRPVTWPVAAI